MAIETVVTARGQSRLPPDEEKILAEWNRELFAPDRAVIEAFSWQDKRNLGFDIRSYYEGEIAGFAHVFPRLGSLDDKPVLLGALGSVMTAKKLQGRGIGSATVAAAASLIRQNLAADLGVLLCHPRLLAFYSRLGWQDAGAPVLLRQDNRPSEWPYCCMLLSANAALPSEPEFDLGGPPF